MVRNPPLGVRVLTGSALLLILLGGCSSTPRDPGPRPARDSVPVPRHLTYISNPTEIRAEKVNVILPIDLGADLKVEGLSSGWEERNGRRIWNGTGQCRLVLDELEIRCLELTVTLVPDQPEPEFLLTAEGHVVLAHVSHGIGNLAEDVGLLMIRNEKRSER